MGDADGSPRDANQPSQNDVLVAPEEDERYFGKLLTHLQEFLPFLTEVINNSELLDILPDRVSKLRYLYELVDAKRLSPDRLKTCKKVFYDLYDNYSNPLNYYLPPDFKTSWMQETKLNDEEKNVSTDVICTINKSNQNQNSESELSNKIPVPSTSYENIVNNQMDCSEDLPPNNENIVDKNFKNVEIGESSCNKNSINDSLLEKNDLPEFSDSRIRLNKIIGFATNASIAKLNKSDASIPHTELPTQIFDEMIKQKNGPVIYKDMLKGINMDDIDVNYVKNVIDGIKRASCVEPVQPPPLPPSDLMDLGASRINLISTTEPNSSEVTRDNVILSKSSTNIRVQLNTEINKLHNTGPLNETKQKFISALKPGTLIDLENSKVVRSSLHIESLRPVIKSNEKSTDVKTSLFDISVPRDPRIRHKTLLTSGNNVNPFNTPASLISNAQYTCPTPFASNRDNSNAKLFDTRAQEIYNGQSSSSHTNIHPLNPLFSSEHNGNSIQLKNRSLSLNHNKHNRSDDKKNDYSQFSNSVQMHVNPSHIEPLIKYCDPVPYKSHSNDASKRDPRTLKSVKTTVHPNYKEHREAKLREQMKGYVKNKNLNQDHDQYRSLGNEKTEKSNIIDSSYNTFGPINETANIKKFKIPKIKHNEELNDNRTERNSKIKIFGDNKNDTDILTTEKKSKIPLKADTIREKYLSNGQKSETNKSKNSKKDLKISDKTIDNLTDKTSEIEININSSTDGDLKIKTMTMNNKSEKDSCPEINLEEITVDIPSKVNKEELDSKSEQNSNLINPTNQSKPKKHKKYSKEKEFEKIIKDAAESLNDDGWGPRTRTRSSVMKKEGIIKTIKVNNSKSKFEKDNTTKNYKKLESGECSKNLDNGSIPNLADDSGRTEIGHNIISSTSKEQSGVVNSTTTEIVCKSQEKNIVSSNEINSTADNSPKIDEKALIDIFKNPQIMTVISMLQDKSKLEKLNKFLESSDVNDDKLKEKCILSKEQIEIDEKKKRRKMKKEKRKRRRMNKSVCEESSTEESKVEFLSDITDNNFNQAENIVKTKRKKSHSNEFYEGNTSSGNFNGHSSTDHHELKSIKRKKSKESYGNFEILKDKCKPELKDLKIVIAKFDKNIKRSDNDNSDISSTSNDVQINDVEIPQEIKSKKPFLGPLSVKLARQKMEMEKNNSQSESEIKNSFEFETKKVRKGSKSIDRFNKKVKLNSETFSSLITEQPIVLLQPLQNPKPFADETIPNKSVKQNSNTSTFTVNKPEIKKARPSELDKLHADISEMFDCEAVLNASNIRQCRTNKQIDYVNTNVVMSKKKKTSNIEPLDSNDDQNEFDRGVEKINDTKKKIKKSTIKLNSKNKFLKKSMAKKTLPPLVVKTPVLNKISNKQQNKLKKTKKRNKKLMKSNRKQLKVVLSDDFELNNVLENNISTEMTSKIVTENKFKDKFYFQTADNSLECKFCNYKDKGLNIVRHYKDQHCEEEVLPSRLPKNCTELLIHQSLKENFGNPNSRDSKPICHQSVNVNYTCVFCQVIFHDYFKFYDHITGHTGEYRYKCKMCEQIYSNEDDLDKHILEHTDYDKTGGISHLIFPNPIRGKYVFGYLCSFCYFVQLDYNNIVKHMASQHFDEDKKLNGHWTALRISMSVADEIYTDSSIDFDNLVGCLPPIHSDQDISISKDNENQNQQLTMMDLNVPSNEQKQPNSFLSIKKESNEQNIDEIPQESNIDEYSPKLIIDEYSPKSNTVENLPKSVTDANPPVTVYDKVLDSTELQLSPEQANQSPKEGTRITTEPLAIQYSEYTLKEKSKKCVMAGLSCEFINSMLLFKCSVSNCQENQFSTVIFIDFSTHINKNHQFVVWDGHCEACHHKLSIVSKQYYVKDALEHLVSHHLVLKNNEHSNTNANLGGSNIECLSSCQDTVENTPYVENFLKVRCLPGDKLSIHKPSSSSITNNCEMSVNESHDDTNSNNKNDYIENPGNPEQSSHNILLGNQCQTSDIVNLNINDGSNDKRFPSQITVVKSLKKGKVNASKINSSASDDSDLNMWMKAKTNCEVILPNSEIFLEEGQQIVNNGVPVDGTICCVIDTTYTKDYIRKVRELPMHVMKTRLALNEMSALPRLLGLFKCMDRTCTKIFSSKDLFKLHMKLHFSNAEKKKVKKNQMYNVEQFKMCAYCFKMFDDEESLANHISEKYRFCEYFCPYCFYRAYTASHVLVHQSVIHTNLSKHCIIKLEYDDDACKYPKEILFVVDFKEFVLPYKCNVGCCGFSCYLQNEFLEHLNQEHQQCDKFCCYICASKDDGEGFFALQPSLLITHFKLHNFNKYQCIFCLFGTEIIDSMIKHLALEHFEYEPLCLERSTVSDNCESKNIRNLKILKLTKVIDNGMVEIVNLPTEAISVPEVLPQRSKKRSIECSDVLSVAMKSARIDEGSQASDTIVITVPDSAQMAESSTSMSLAMDNEFIMIDDVNQNDMQETLKINRIWSESNSKEKEPKVSSNDDIIIIDDEDDVDLSEKEELNEGPTKRMCLEIEESINGSNKGKRLAFPIIELDKLFVCKECEKVFSNSQMYSEHLNVCPYWDYAAGKKCIHCAKVFKTILNMTEHAKLHGPDRFKCSLCNLKVPSERAISHHMKNSHKIINLDFVPEIPNLTNVNKDEFIVFEDKTIIEQKKLKMNSLLTCNKCSFKGNTRKMIISHMKTAHKAEQNLDCGDNLYKITPEQSNDTNNSVNSLMPQQNEQQNASLKRKRSTNFGNQKGSAKAKPIIKNQSKTLFFSPDTIDSIPKSHIFSDPISCLLCAYSTKVRSNLVIHLIGHTKGQDNTTKEIVNPVPSMGKCELMFDKMINLSASAFDAMNTEKIKRDELDKKIVEVAPDESLNIEIFPQFIPKNMRYKCSVTRCSYTGVTEDMLKKHISILHPTHECYICPHCLPPCIISKFVERNQIEFHLMHHGANLYRCQYCDYIDFNRVEMRTHMRNTHLSEITSSVQSNIIVIRQTMLEDDSIDRGRSKAPSNVPQWVCNICSNGLRYTENEITSHILMAHKVSNMFKCPMCQFEHEDDNANIFEEHYKLQHPSVAVKCLRVFEKISDNEELHKQSKHLGGTEYMLEQQALESIEPTLVPPTCRGIPIESTPLKTSNKSRVMAKSPKSATKSSPIQTHKQKTLIDVFNKNDKLGAISSNGHFVCPKCCVFETMNIELFREHLYKEVNYKTWKCLICFEISDSPKKMAWHVKKHGIGSKYEKIEDGEKLKWVDRVIGHQHMLLAEFNKNSKAKHVKSVESSKAIIVNSKRTSYSPTKKKNIEREKKAFVSQPTPDPVSNDDIIDLVDDSDDE